MVEDQPQFLTVGRGDAARRIAYLSRPGRAPGLLWLQGFKSEMISVKATALAAWATENGRAITRFDYSGHGMSEGCFESTTLSDWLEETASVFTGLTAGRQIVVGSSMGGFLALLLLRRLLTTAPAQAERIAAMILIAPAWDMTQELMWKRFSADARRAVMEGGVWLRPSEYGDPYPITRRLIEDGRRHSIGTQPWNPGRPVHIIHGRLDPDVPFAHSERLLEILQGPSVRLTEVPDGEHRLSRPQDLQVLFAALGEAVA